MTVSTEVFNILKFSLIIAYVSVFISFFAFIIYLLENRRILLNLIFETVIFLILNLNLIILLYLFTNYKNFNFFLYLISYLSLRLKNLYNRKIPHVLFIISILFFSSSIIVYFLPKKLEYTLSFNNVLSLFVILTKFLSILIFLYTAYYFVPYFFSIFNSLLFGHNLILKSPFN